MRILFWIASALLCGGPLGAACTTSGHPPVVNLKSHVIEVRDDAAYQAGKDVWVPGAVKSDAQVFPWLVWSSQPGGQSCRASLAERFNDTCGARLSVEFRQVTPYNVGIAVADAPPAGSSTTYPFSCSAELRFYIVDPTPIPNPDYDPKDPMSPAYFTDPGFDFFTKINLEVTGEQYVNPGGVGTVPTGVMRDGCVEGQAGDLFPDYMLIGPGCPGRTAATAIKSTASTKLAKTLAGIAAKTTVRAGRAGRVLAAF